VILSAELLCYICSECRFIIRAELRRARTFEGKDYTQPRSNNLVIPFTYEHKSYTNYGTLHIYVHTGLEVDLSHYRNPPKGNMHRSVTIRWLYKCMCVHWSRSSSEVQTQRVPEVGLRVPIYPKNTSTPVNAYLFSWKEFACDLNFVPDRCLFCIEFES